MNWTVVLCNFFVCLVVCVALVVTGSLWSFLGLFFLFYKGWDTPQETQETQEPEPENEEEDEE
jgi:hypothetical protein